MSCVTLQSKEAIEATDSVSFGAYGVAMRPSTTRGSRVSSKSSAKGSGLPALNCVDETMDWMTRMASLLSVRAARMASLESLRPCLARRWRTELATASDIAAIASNES